MFQCLNKFQNITFENETNLQDLRQFINILLFNFTLLEIVSWIIMFAVENISKYKNYLTVTVFCHSSVKSDIISIIIDRKNTLRNVEKSWSSHVVFEVLVHLHGQLETCPMVLNYFRCVSLMNGSNPIFLLIILINLLNSWSSTHCRGSMVYIKKA